jgi:hypothetical protein
MHEENHGASSLQFSPFRGAAAAGPGSGFGFAVGTGNLCDPSAFEQGRL